MDIYSMGIRREFAQLTSFSAANMIAFSTHPLSRTRGSQRTMSTSCSHRAAAPAKSIYFHSILIEMIIGFGTRYVQSTPACLFLKPRTPFLPTEVSQSNIGLIFTAGTSQYPNKTAEACLF